MAKRGRKKSINPNEHAVYMRGYRAGYKRGINAPGIVEKTVRDMFKIFRVRQVRLQVRHGFLGSSSPSFRLCRRLGEVDLLFLPPPHYIRHKQSQLGGFMHKNDRETMIKELMTVKLRRRLLEKMKDSEIQNLFFILKRHFK